MSVLVDTATLPRPPRATVDLSLPAPVYHEKQRLMRCGVHSINNLFQCALYDKFSFDAICEQLAPDVWLNPHRSALGVGNYDINVLILAIEAEGYELHWHDRRQPLSALSSPPLLGFIVNQTTPRLFSLYHSQHWYPVRAFDHGRAWYALNSVSPRAEPIADVVAYCQQLLAEPTTQLLLIVRKGTPREALYTAHGFTAFPIDDAPHPQTVIEGQPTGT